MEMSKSQSENVKDHYIHKTDRRYNTAEYNPHKYLKQEHQLDELLRGKYHDFKYFDSQYRGFS